MLLKTKESRCRGKARRAPTDCLISWGFLLSPFPATRHWRSKRFAAMNEFYGHDFLVTQSDGQSAISILNLPDISVGGFVHRGSELVAKTVIRCIAAYRVTRSEERNYFVLGHRFLRVQTHPADNVPVGNVNRKFSRHRVCDRKVHHRSASIRFVPDPIWLTQDFQRVFASAFSHYETAVLSCLPGPPSDFFRLTFQPRSQEQNCH